MQKPNDAEIDVRLTGFLGQIGQVLGNKKQRACFAGYVTGLLSDAERKSAEPIAAMLWPDPEEIDAAHQRLLHFIGQADWNDSPVRSLAARYAINEMLRREPVQAWINDDTGFLKQGKHSVGVQRQYTGSAGKVTNCQIGASLTLVTKTMQLPVDFELYLPRTWTDDLDRRREAKIPDNVGFRTKPQLALAMIDRALDAGLPQGRVLADAAYGNSVDYRVGLRRRGLPYAVDIEGRTKVRVLGARGRIGESISARDVARSLGIRRYRRVTWREGSKKTLWSMFAARRVVVDRDTKKLGRREVMWLLIEWPPDEAVPAKFTLLTAPKQVSVVSLVRISRQRWRTERVYEDLKGELGLDHFEGRRFRGWHHHVTVALCCYAFVAAEHARSFPPKARRSRTAGSKRRTPRETLRRFAHQHAAPNRAHGRTMVASLPDLPSRAPPPRELALTFVTQ